MLVRARLRITTLRVQIVQPTLTGPGLWGALTDDPIEFSVPWTTTVEDLREDLGVTTVRPLVPPRVDANPVPRRVGDLSLLQHYANGAGLVRVWTVDATVPGPFVLFVKKLCPVTRTLATVRSLWFNYSMTPRRLMAEAFHDETLEAVIEPRHCACEPLVLRDSDDLSALDGHCLIVYPRGMIDDVLRIIATWNTVTKSAIASMVRRRYLSFYRVVPALERLGYNGERVMAAYKRMGYPSAGDMLSFLRPGRHLDYCCDACGIEDFVGTRYTCVVCADYDLCRACRDATPTHHGWRYAYVPGVTWDSRRWQKIPGSLHTVEHDMIAHEAPTWL
jgi:hypothetical protein